MPRWPDRTPSWVDGYDDLNTALKRFTELNLDELPVVEKGNPKKLLGMLRRKDVIAHYIQTLLARNSRAN